MQTIMYSCFKVYNELCWIFFCIIRRTVINEFLVYFKAYNSNSLFILNKAEHPVMYFCRF